MNLALAALIVALHPGLPAVLSAEEMTFVTYYPSPTGNYLNMSTTGKTTLATGGSTDRVGIGTTAPQYKLHVEGETKMKMTDLKPLTDVNPLLSGETNPEAGRLYYYTGTGAPNRPTGLYFYHDGAWYKIQMKEVATEVLVGQASLSTPKIIASAAGFVYDTELEPLTAGPGTVVPIFGWDTLQVDLTSEGKDWKVRFEWGGTINVNAKSGEGVEIILQWRKVAASTTFSELQKSDKLEDSDGLEDTPPGGTNSASFFFDSHEETLKKGNAYQFRFKMHPTNNNDVGTNTNAPSPTGAVYVKIWRTGKE